MNAIATMNNRIKPILAALVPLALAGAPANLAAATLLIKNAVIHPVAAPEIPNGQVLVTDDTITTVTNGQPALTADETIDLAGQHLFPGLINASGWLGLSEIASVRGTRDMQEVGAFTPEVLAWLAVNPDSELIAFARANGVTHTVAVPNGGTISGQSGLVALGGGWTTEQLAVKAPAALNLFWPSMELNTTPRDQARDKENWKSLEDQARERRLQLGQIEDFFAEAEAYAASPQRDARRIPAWEAMRPFVHRDIPLVIYADEFRQIKAAIDFAKKHPYRVILSGARDAWMLARELAEARIAVIYEHVFDEEIRDTEPYDVHFYAPAVLAEAGVSVAIAEGLGASAATSVRNLPYTAAQAMAYGLPREQALKAITLVPAEIFGVADKLGTIAPGRDATFLAASGDILDIRSKVSRVWIHGEPVSLENRQTRLYDKYRSRPLPPQNP